ncbi:FGGY family carbohydrate kinase [Pelagibacteraceae bacterium]|nr:FGGY family carbohydrate kinase [Pelagibacteraceae bacterium]
MQTIVSLDVGTSVIKCVLFDTKFNQIKIFSVNNIVSYDKLGHSEISMNKLWLICRNLLIKSFKYSKKNKLKVITIGITANMVGLWPIDYKGRPVRNGILWNDLRTSQLMYKLKLRNKNIYDDIFSISGSVMQFGCTIPLIKWFYDNEKNNYKKTRWFLNCKDWIRYKLTNDISNDFTEVVVSPGDAKKINRSYKILKIFNINKDIINKFPKILKSNTISGYTTKNINQLLNLKYPIPVSVGAGDVPSSVIGLGVNKENSAATIFGTTIHNCFVSNRPIFYPKNIGLLFYSPNKLWLKTMINIAGTINLDWILKNFFKYNINTNIEKNLNQIEKFIIKNNINSNGIFFLPYLNHGGVIAPFFNENASGVIYGLNQDHNKYNIIQSVYEGLVLSIFDCYEKFNKKIKFIYLAGGATKSLILPQMISDILNKKIYIPEGKEFGAKGAAMIAYSSISKVSLSNKIFNQNRISKIFTPNKKKYIEYQLKYKYYKQLSRKLFDV